MTHVSITHQKTAQPALASLCEQQHPQAQPATSTAMAPNTASENACLTNPAATTSVDAFDFFALARELRDACYDELLDVKQLIEVRHARGFHLELSGMPTVALQSVSKQFRAEILERAEKTGKLRARYAANKIVWLWAFPPAILHTVKHRYFQ